MTFLVFLTIQLIYLTKYKIFLGLLKIILVIQHQEIKTRQPVPRKEDHGRRDGKLALIKDIKRYVHLQKLGERQKNQNNRLFQVLFVIYI